MLPLQHHMQLHSSQLRESAGPKDHPTHHHLYDPDTPRLKKMTIFNCSYPVKVATLIEQERMDEEIKINQRIVHTESVKRHTDGRGDSKVLNRKAPSVSRSKESLSRKERRLLAQLRTGKSPLLKE